MKFIALLSLKSNVTQAKYAEAIARRAEYKYPPGVQLLAEYWTTSTSPAVVVVLEAKEALPMLMNSAGWVDVFEMESFPVVDWQEGLKAFASLAGKP